MESQKILNPLTKRYVNVGSQQYNKLVLEGLIKPPEEKAPEAEETPPVKALLAETLTDVVKQNKKQFEKEMTQQECDTLLRKLLYAKLCIKEPKPDKKKKKKFKVRAPPPSSESESESSD